MILARWDAQDKIKRISAMIDAPPCVGSILHNSMLTLIL